MGFWIAAVLMIVLALVFVLPPLVRGPAAPRPGERRPELLLHRQRLDELEADRAGGVIGAQEYELARRELEHAALLAIDASGGEAVPPPAASPVLSLIVAVLVPLAASGLYLVLGTPEALLSAKAPAHASNSIEEMVARLEARLEANPDDAQGWTMLGRSYLALERVGAARAAYARAVSLSPEDTALLVDYAQVLAREHDGDLRGEATRILDRALRLEPLNPRALLLGGVAAYQSGDADTAIARLEQFRALEHPDAEAARLVDAMIARARAEGAEPAPVTATEPAPVAAAAARIVVNVTLAPALAGRAGPQDAVFVFARAAAGPAMPLAVARRTVADLPFTVTLEDSMAMTPGLRLSRHSQVIVGARVSRTGEPVARPGDLQGMSGPLDPATGPRVNLPIDQIVP